MSLKNCLFEDFDEVGLKLEQARDEFMARYAEAQILLPGTVTKAARPVYDTLTEAYGNVKREMRLAGRSLDEAGRATLKAYLNGDVDAALRVLRKAMRRDLGIAD